MPPETSTTEPETLDAASVAEIATDTRKPDSYLDGVAEYLKGGAMPAGRILAQVFQNTENDPEQIAALERQMAADPRFVSYADGWDLVGLPPAEGKSIGECMAANEANADRLAEEMEYTTGQGASGAVFLTPVEGTGSETMVGFDPAAPGADQTVTLDPKDEEILRLRRKLAAACDELDAFHERQAKEKELTDAINRASRDVEAAKEVLAGKKAALATAHEQLFLHASGDTQTSHPDLREPENDDGDDDEDETGRPAPAVQPVTIATAQAPEPIPETPATPAAQPEPVKPFTHDVAVDQVVTDHGIDLLRLRACLRRDILPSERPLQVGPAVIELKGCQWLVRDHSPSEDRWFLQRVLSKDEWEQMHEKEFGRYVKGFDQNDEAKHHRQQGGDECGLVVKVGRKDGVLGPEREGLVLVLPLAETAKVIDGASAFDAKAAAAGDSQPDGSLRNEQDSFVAGDTPGGVVNSDPND